MVNASDSGYNHVTDQASNLTVAATLLARSLYTLATGSPAPEGLMAEQQSVREKILLDENWWWNNLFYSFYKHLHSTFKTYYIVAKK